MKIDPDGEPARPGLFQFQGDAQWKIPHDFTFCLAGKTLAQGRRGMFSSIHRLARYLLLRSQNPEPDLVGSRSQRMQGCIRLIQIVFSVARGPMESSFKQQIWALPK
jgi:hypothetical protein